MVEPWLLVFAATFVLIHLLGFGYLLFVRRVVATDDTPMSDGLQAAAAEGAGEDPPEPPERLHADVGEREAVRCGSCGVINDRTFRFCRNCVAELGGGGTARRESRAPSGRGLF